MKVKRFNPFEREQVSPFGDTYVIAGAGRKGQCHKCGRSVFAVIEKSGRLNEPDPRGFAGPRHSLTTFEEFPGIPFCWDCVNEHGYEGYSLCRKIAEAGQFRPPTGRESVQP